VLWITDGDDLPASAPEAVDFAGFAWHYAPGMPEAIEYLKRSRVDAAIARMPIGDWTSVELLEEFQRTDDQVPLIIWDPGASVEDAVRLIKLGAYHVLGGQTESAGVAGVLQAAIQDRHGQIPEDAEEPWRSILVGSSRSFQDVVRMVRLVGSRRCTVLLTGETGTGKEMVARALHMAGPRARFPMVPVCCSALPESLLEAELFGHVRGAFTGAVQQRIGRFEQANGGTLFLDEIGDMPLDLQAKLLRVLQEREFQRLGSSETIRVDVRVLAATNADLLERVREGRFREDLYYRLAVVPIHLPPLRERGGDVPALARYFIHKICELENIAPKQICREALDRLAGYSWPGNVRELENSIERAVVLSGDRPTLYPADFPLAGPARTKLQRVGAPLVQVPEDGLDFEQTVGQIARSILEQALRKTKGNKKLAADMLRLKRTTLAAKLRSLETDDSGMALMDSDFGHSA